jgi:phosphate transport system protein
MSESEVSTRATLDQEIQELKTDLLAMGDMVDRAIVRSIQALKDRDMELARQIVLDDEKINAAEESVKDRVITTIATQQPMASDLRIIMAVSALVTELERMGDHAAGIAKITLRMGSLPPLKPLIDIPRMAEKGRWVMQEELKAFIDQDVERARNAALCDQEVDALYDQIYRELLIFMMDDPRTITRATYLLWVAHNLERISDRATNIGERVIYMVSSRTEDLNP